jgi:hypothetical protein
MRSKEAPLFCKIIHYYIIISNEIGTVKYILKIKWIKAKKSAPKYNGTDLSSNPWALNEI